jgi:hypothetical protein
MLRLAPKQTAMVTAFGGSGGWFGRFTASEIGFRPHKKRRGIVALRPIPHPQPRAAHFTLESTLKYVLGFVK